MKLKKKFKYRLDRFRAEPNFIVYIQYSSYSAIQWESVIYIKIILCNFYHCRYPKIVLVTSTKISV